MKTTFGTQGRFFCPILDQKWDKRTVPVYHFANDCTEKLDYEGTKSTLSKKKTFNFVAFCFTGCKIKKNLKELLNQTANNKSYKGFNQLINN